MKCVSINIDRGIPVQSLPNKIRLKDTAIDANLFKEAKKSWDKVELAYYTAYYGQTLYQKSQFDGVMYVDHEKRLDSEYVYIEQMRKEKMKAQKKLNNLRPKFYVNKKSLQEKIEPIAKSLKYHMLEYDVFEVTSEHYLSIKKGKHKGRNHYSFRYNFQEKEEPDFGHYEMLLFKGWGRDIGSHLQVYDKTESDKNLPDFIEEVEQGKNIRSEL